METLKDFILYCTSKKVIMSIKYIEYNFVQFIFEQKDKLGSFSFKITTEAYEDIAEHLLVGKLKHGFDSEILGFDGGGVIKDTCPGGSLAHISEMMMNGKCFWCGKGA